MTYLIAAIFGVLLWIGFLRLVRWMKIQRWEWLTVESGGVPWAPIRYFNAIGEEHGNQDILFVSRHDIAECGLVCPRCKANVVERGDFTAVRRTIINGTENEVVKCTGTFFVDELEHPCGLWLAASPDTEHGDHLNDDGTVNATGSNDTPDFWKFKRISPEQALREKYGADVVTSTTGMEIDPSLHTPIPAEPAPPAGQKHNVLMGEELQVAIREALQAEQAKAPIADAMAAPTVVVAKLPDSDITPVVAHPVPAKDGPHV